jgi:hypothetical protein
VADDLFAPTGWAAIPGQRLEFKNAGTNSETAERRKRWVG